MLRPVCNITKTDITKLKLGIENVWIPTITSVRYRYWKDKIERGPLHRKVYDDKLLTRGMLPHCAEINRKLPLKEHKPRNMWAPKYALFGKNDYIDILGDGRLRPTDVGYSVPYWLRGFKGNEYQMLLRRHGTMGESMKEYRPHMYSDMMLRMKWLYAYLNTKTKDYYWKDT